MKYRKNAFLTPEVQANMDALRRGEQIPTLDATWKHICYEFENREPSADDIYAIKRLRSAGWSNEMIRSVVGIRMSVIRNTVRGIPRGEDAVKNDEQAQMFETLEKAFPNLTQ